MTERAYERNAACWCRTGQNCQFCAYCRSGRTCERPTRENRKSMNPNYDPERMKGW